MEVKKSAAIPAKGNLFEEDQGEEQKELGETESERFHHTTAKLLYLSKRVRIDTDLAVSFLCTRVATPTLGDKQKLLRMLSYLNGTRKMYRVIGSNGLDYLQTWIDASYAVHRDMRGHT